MAWRDVLQDTVTISSDTQFTTVFSTVWYNTPFACLPGTGLRDLIEHTIKNSNNSSLQWRLFDIAANHNLVTPVLVHFLEDQIQKNPADAWLHATYNFNLLKDIQTAPTDFSSYTSGAQTKDRVHLMRHMYLHLSPPKQDLDMSHEMIDAILQFCLDLFSVSNEKVRATIVDYVNRFLMRVSGFTVPHKDSVRAKLVEMAKEWLSANEYHSFFAASSILCKVLRCTRPSSTVFKEVIAGTYESILAATFVLPPSLFSTIEEVSPGFDGLPWESLTKRVKGAASGYQNSLVLTTQACSYDFWSNKIVPCYAWTDFKLLKKDHALAAFVTSHYDRLLSTVQDCKDVLVSSCDTNALPLIQSIPLKHLKEAPVFDRLLQVVSNRNQDYNTRINCVVTIVAKVVRVFNDNEDLQYYNEVFQCLANKLQDMEEYDMLSVCTRGVNMVPENNRSIHNEFLSLIASVLEVKEISISTLAPDLRSYAQNHPHPFLDVLVQQLVSKQLVRQLVAVCPSMNSVPRTPVWSRTEKTITRAVLLEFRATGNPKPILNLSRRFKRASAPTRFRIFETLFHTSMEVVDKLSMKSGMVAQKLPLHFSRNLAAISEFLPSQNDLLKITPEIEFKARCLHGMYPTVAVVLLWLVRHNPSFWWHSFLVSCLRQRSLVFSDDNLSRTIETFMWTCHKFNHDPLPHTLCNSSSRVRRLTQDLLCESEKELCNFMCGAITNTLKASKYDILRYATQLTPVIARSTDRSLLNHLCREFHTGIPQEYHRDVLYLLHDTVKLNRRVLSYTYARELAKWIVGLVPLIFYHCHPIIADICCELLDYLYHIDHKRSTAYLEALDGCSKTVKRSCRRQPVQQNRLQTLTPEITSTIKSFLELPSV